MGNDEPESDLADLRDAILHYLRNNPNAADSLEGIMNYWLLQAYKKIDRARIEQVLDHLIDEGQVRKITLAGGTIIYRQEESRN